MTTTTRQASHCICGLKLIEAGEELRCPSPAAAPGGPRSLRHSRFSNPVRGGVGSGSPWGRIEHIERIAAGVDVVHTASHGGLRLSHEVTDRLPSDVLHSFYHGPGWAEEDCEAGIVLVLLGLARDERDKLAALSVAMRYERYRVAESYIEAVTDYEVVEAAG